MEPAMQAFDEMVARKLEPDMPCMRAALEVRPGLWPAPSWRAGVNFAAVAPSAFAAKREPAWTDIAPGAELGGRALELYNDELATHPKKRLTIHLKHYKTAQTPARRL